MLFYLRMSHRTPFTVWQYFGAITKKKNTCASDMTYIQATTELRSLYDDMIYLFPFVVLLKLVLSQVFLFKPIELAFELSTPLKQKINIKNTMTHTVSINKHDYHA